MFDYLESLKEIRNTNIDTLKKTLKIAFDLDEVSEVQFRDIWLNELKKNDFFKDGWYTPPPYGIAVLFGSLDSERINFNNLRKKDYWPRDDVFLEKDSILHLYASPVDKEGIIGDFGLTIYLGEDEKIISHFKKVYSITKKIFDSIKLGQSFSEISGNAVTRIRDEGLYNNIDCVTSDLNNNIGHTIPESFSEEELDIIEKQGWNDELKAIISKKRIFISEGENTILKANQAFTIEPRMVDKGLPMVFFHLVGYLDKDNKKHLIGDFDDIFNITDMNYMVD